MIILPITNRRIKKRRNIQRDGGLVVICNTGERTTSEFVCFPLFLHSTFKKPTCTLIDVNKIGSSARQKNNIVSSIKDSG